MPISSLKRKKYDKSILLVVSLMFNLILPWSLIVCYSLSRNRSRSVQTNSDKTCLGFHKAVVFVGWTMDHLSCKNDVFLHINKQHSAHNLITCWAHLEHMQTFGRQPMTLSSEPRWDTSFLVGESVGWVPCANERNEFGFVFIQRHQN